MLKNASRLAFKIDIVKDVSNEETQKKEEIVHQTGDLALIKFSRGYFNLPILKILVHLKVVVVVSG